MSQEYDLLELSPDETSRKAVTEFADFLYHMAIIQFAGEPDAIQLTRLLRFEELSSSELGDILQRAPSAVRASHIAFVEPLYNEPGPLPAMGRRIPHEEKAIYFTVVKDETAHRAINAIDTVRKNNPHGGEMILLRGADGKARLYVAGAVVNNVAKGPEVTQ